jgi:hypothetical protein
MHQHKRTAGGLGFDISSRRNGGGGFVPHVIVRCHKCPSRLEFPAIGRTPPEHVAKAIRQKGWEFTLGSYSKTRCPECQVEEAEARAGDSSKQVVTMLGKEVAVPKEILEPAATPQVAKPKREVRDLQLTIRSDRPLIEVVRALQGYGELVGLNAAAAEPPLVVEATMPAPPAPPAPQSDWQPATQSATPNNIVQPTKAPPASRSKKPRTSLPPRYRHPNLPYCEWSGAGRRPTWLIDFLKTPGHSLEQCRLNAAHH